MDIIPTDISMKIYKMAMKLKHEDNQRQITATIWHTLHFIQSSTVLYNEVPLFEGSSKNLYVTVFNVDKIQQAHGLISTRMVFFINDDEFEVTHNDYNDGEIDVSMYTVNKDGLYADLAADAFFQCFPNGMVY